MRFYADAHCDALMWNRDLTQVSSKGHVDFPRLKAAGVKLQCFTIVTRGFPVIDGFGLFARKQRWPKEARQSEWSRCCWQLDRMDELCGRSLGDVSVATRAADLEGSGISAVLGIEGAHAVEGKIDRVAELYARGVRFMSPVHLTNNALGGTSSPMQGNRPLTALGHEMIDAMASAGMAIDVVHSSIATLRDIFTHQNLRVLSSHTGVSAEHDTWRNIPDWVLKEIANRGGVVGIIFAPRYLGGWSFDDVVRHITHAIDVMGEDAVSFGSDYDGMVPLPRGMRDVRDLPKLAQALEGKMPAARVDKICGLNLKRFFAGLLQR
jgi:membrane dipeptidase